MRTMEAMVGSLGDVGRVLLALAHGSVAVRREIALRRGQRGEVNVYGERQTELDVWANDHFVDILGRSGVVSAVASEEMDGVKEVGQGALAVAMDPLDGSSNVRTNNPLGSIFGIWPREDFPGPGRSMRTAAYALYGPALTFTTALPDGVHEFIYLEQEKVFIHSQGPIRLGDQRYYGMGGERSDWLPGFRRFVETLDERKFKLRYCGCFVGDFHQILLHGGFFAYPGLKSKPEGKYRLMYESAPMAFILEAAGGASTDGTRDILDVVPGRTSQTCPTYLGSKDLIEELQGYLATEFNDLTEGPRAQRGP